MVGGVPAQLVFRDAFFAAGLGLILCLLYSMARFFLTPSKIGMLCCDAAIFLVGALLYRSAAIGRFYAGVPRWYTMAACIGAFLLCRRSFAPLLDRLQKKLRVILRFPFAQLQKYVVLPLQSAIRKRVEQQRNKKIQKRKKRVAKKRLQNNKQVLYNSK